MFSLSRFGDLLKYLPRAQLDRIVGRHKADRYVKRFGCHQLLVTMIYAHLSGARSLRQLEVGLNQHANHHYHLGLGEVSRSTVADACAKRKPEVFEDLARLLIQAAGQAVRRQRKELLYLLDSTSIALMGRGLQWAGQFKTRIPALKIHLLYASNQQVPVYFTITGENVPDGNEGVKIPLEPGATYVFDKGYCDYGWWGRIDAAGARFVTRLKKNAAVRVERTRALDADVHSVLSDLEVSFKHSSNRGGHRNAFASARLRRIEVARENDESLVLITNDLESSAATIASLYKERWQIELFFKWIKQNLKIKNFLGESENAIRIQLLTGLITYLLMALKKAATQTSESLRRMLDEIRTGPFSRPQQESRYRERRRRDELVQALQQPLFR